MLKSQQIHVNHTLRDSLTSDEPPVNTIIELCEHAIEIGVDGYGECCAADGYGRQVRIELYGGQLRVIVHGDINQEDPTHIISLGFCIRG